MGLKIAGETWQDFIKKNGIESDGTNKCVVCKREFIEPTDWGYFKDHAYINWKHDNCRNTGPAKAVSKDKDLVAMLNQYFKQKDEVKECFIEKNQ